MRRGIRAGPLRWTLPQRSLIDCKALAPSQPDGPDASAGSVTHISMIKLGERCAPMPGGRRQPYPNWSSRQYANVTVLRPGGNPCFLPNYTPLGIENVGGGSDAEYRW
jgi:hypothetical protein